LYDLTANKVDEVGLADIWTLLREVDGSYRTDGGTKQALKTWARYSQAVLNDREGIPSDPTVPATRDADITAIVSAIEANVAPAPE
jgi:hypothetical protein